MKYKYDNNWFSGVLYQDQNNDRREDVLIPCRTAAQYFHKDLRDLQCISRDDGTYYSLPSLESICDSVDQKDDEVILREILEPALQERMAYYTEQMKLAADAAGHPKRYERQPFMDMCDLHGTLFVIHQWQMFGPPLVPADNILPMVRRMQELRESLTPLKDNDEQCWDIWENSPLPCVQDMADADWRYCFDSEGFRPFLIPFMLEDQSASKGNIIVISGGGYAWRSNRWEGYEAVQRMNDLGWNCFLLQRRVTPYDRIDGALDLQRSVRFIRSHAEEFGIAQPDKISALGFSGGGMCILDMLAHCPDSVIPSALCPGYTGDAVDTADSSLRAVLILYGSRMNPEEYSLLTNNPDPPAFFITVGQNDPLGMPQGALNLYEAVAGQVPAELHIIQNTGHGFGTGIGVNSSDPLSPYIERTVNTEIWPDLADMFLDIRLGNRPQFVKV